MSCSERRTLSHTGFAEVEQAVQKGHAGRLHRVAQKFLMDDAHPHKLELRAFADNIAELGAASELALLRYGQSPTVMRKTEGAHTVVKTYVKKAPATLPSLINTKLKRRELFGKLEKEPFLPFCCAFVASPPAR